MVKSAKLIRSLETVSAAHCRDVRIEAFKQWLGLLDKNQVVKRCRF